MISDYYTETFTVEAASSTVSALGSWNPTWTTAGTIKGWIDQIRGDEQQIAAQWAEKATHIVGCSSTCSWVQNNHRIKDSASKIYRVLDIDNPLRRNHHLEILLEYNAADNRST